MNNGYGQPFVNIWNQENEYLGLKVTRVQYTYDEESGDSCNITIESEFAETLDNPNIQDHRALFLQWGYLNSKVSKKRMVFILDSSSNFTENGLVIDLYCHAKGYYSKLQESQEVKENKDLNDYGKEFSDKWGLKYINPQSDYISTLEWVRNNPEFENYIRSHPGWEVNLQLDELTLRDAIVNANRSDWSTFKELVGKEKGGPFDVVLRDNEVILRKRDFNKPPLRSWTWKGGKGELLQFSYTSNNREKMKGATNIEVSGWDPKTKEFLQGNFNAVHDDHARLQDIECTSPRNFVHDGSTKVPDLYTLEVLKGEVPELEQIHRESWNMSGDVDLWNSLIGEDSTSVEYYMELAKSGEILEVSKQWGNSEEYDEVENGEVNIPLIKLRPEKPSYFNENEVWTYSIDNTAVYKEILVNIDWSKRKIVEDEYDDMGDGIMGEAASERADEVMKINSAEGKVLGDPLVESGQVYSFLGLGIRHSGNWYTMKAVHDITQFGYTTSLTVTRDSMGLTDTNGPEAEVDKTQSPKNSVVTTTEETPNEVEITSEDPEKTTECRGLTNEELDAIARLESIKKELESQETSVFSFSNLFLSIGTAIRLILASSDDSKAEDYVLNPEVQSSINTIYGMSEKINRGIICRTDNIVAKANELTSFIREKLLPALKRLNDGD